MVHTAFYRGLEQAQRALANIPDASERAARAHQLADAMVEAEDRGWACRAGCAHCCRHPVGITWPESVRLVAAIRALPDERRAELAVRLREAATTTAARSWRELAALPCPLLVDERCSVYDARPLPCRAFGSTDAVACADAATGKPVAVPFDRDTFGQGLGMGSALAVEHGHRELRAALAAVLAASPAAAILAFAAARPAGDGE